MCFMCFLPAPSVYEWNRECRVWLNCFFDSFAPKAVDTQPGNFRIDRVKSTWYHT